MKMAGSYANPTGIPGYQVLDPVLDILQKILFDPDSRKKQMD
jgi:hypothetical protein